MMLDDFMIRATLAGTGVAFAAAPLGCFVVWRRTVYFGVATAHAAMLGVVLSLAMQMSIFPGTAMVALAMAATVNLLTGRRYAMDTILGALAQSALAFGLVAISFLSGVRIDLTACLFGDILAVSRSDLLVIWVGAALVVALITSRWQALPTATLHEELAYTSRLDPRRELQMATMQGTRNGSSASVFLGPNVQASCLRMHCCSHGTHGAANLANSAVRYRRMRIPCGCASGIAQPAESLRRRHGLLFCDC